jgi:hypothetical protein
VNIYGGAQRSCGEYRQDCYAAATVISNENIFASGIDTKKSGGCAFRTYNIERF